MNKEAIHELAKKRAQEALDYHRTNREAAKDDLAFAAGEQWPELIVEQRRKDNRPCLTFNRTLQFVRQVTGDIRQSPPALMAAPADDGADIQTAKVLSGIIRDIERDSDAQSAYVNAAEGAATCGEGHFRLTTDYEDDDSPNLKLVVKPIRDHLSVVWDPYAQDKNKADARYCFVYDRMPLADFKEEYPKADTTDFQDTSTETPNLKEGWWDGENVTVAEYWWIETKKKARAYFDDGKKLELDDLDEQAGAAARKDAKKVREREEKTVWSCLVSGSEVLTEPVKWNGRRIPVFTVPGQEVAVGDRVIRMGLVRPIKDANRAYNFMRSAAIEAMALAPKAPMTGTPDMIKGHEAIWRKAVKGNVDFLPFNPDKMMPGARPERVMPPAPAIGLAQESMAAIEDMYGSTGIYPSSLGQKSNETSGRAILARKTEGETGTYLYVDNLGSAIRAMGKELVFLIPKIYDTERVMRILGEEGDQGVAKINVPTPDGPKMFVQQTGKPPMVLPPLDAGRYDVEVKTGPTFATRREEARESLLAFVQAVPQAGAAAADLIAKNMDWPGAEELAERLKPQPQNAPPPDPKVMADAQAKLAQAEKTQAETQGIALDNASKQIELAAVTGQIQQAVATAIAQALPMAVTQTIAAMMQQAQMAQPAPMMPPQGMM